MEELAPDLFQFRLDAHRVVSLIFRTRNGSDWPRDCREHDLSRQESSISHRIFCPQKSRSLTFFTSIGATFVRAKFFCSDVASLRLWLCYYRQRSLKIFSTPSGSRKDFLTVASDA
jgi:hypothetical protein